MSEKFVSKVVDENGDGLDVKRVVQVGSGGVGLEWLPTTRRHVDWIAWSLRLLEEHVKLQTGAPLVRMDRIVNFYRVTLLK